MYCHINRLKTQQILITNFEHVLMVEPLIYKILLSCHKQHQIFQASIGFSGSFNKHGYVNNSANNIWLGKQFNQILYSQRNDSVNIWLQEQFNQTIYRQTNGSIKQYAVQNQKITPKKNILNIARQSRLMTHNLNRRIPLHTQLK